MLFLLLNLIDRQKSNCMRVVVEESAKLAVDQTRHRGDKILRVGPWCTGQSTIPAALSLPTDCRTIPRRYPSGGTTTGTTVRSLSLALTYRLVPVLTPVTPVSSGAVEIPIQPQPKPQPRTPPKRHGVWCRFKSPLCPPLFLIARLIRSF